MAAEVALVHLDLAKQRSCILTLLGNDLAQTMEISAAVLLFTSTREAAVRAVDPGTRCSIQRLCELDSKRLFRIPAPS